MKTAFLLPVYFSLLVFLSCYSGNIGLASTQVSTKDLTTDDSYSSVYVSPRDGLKDFDKIIALPGQPAGTADSDQYLRSDGSDDGRLDHSVEVISWEPRAVIYHNFLSQEECEHLINIAKPHMEKSTILNTDTGKRKLDRWVRTCSVTYLDRGQDEIVRAIEKRIADFTFLPVEHGEGLQVLHYEVGQKYEPHFDFFHDDYNTRNGGQRMATVLMYLSDVEEGGETIFPFAKGNFSDVRRWNGLSDCGKVGLSVKPKMGDALLFWSMKPDATTDHSSFHGGCHVIKGNKWSATKWIRVKEYDLNA